MCRRGLLLFLIFFSAGIVNAEWEQLPGYERIVTPDSSTINRFIIEGDSIYLATTRKVGFDTATHKFYGFHGKNGTYFTEKILTGDKYKFNLFSSVSPDMNTYSLFSSKEGYRGESNEIARKTFLLNNDSLIVSDIYKTAPHPYPGGYQEFKILNIARDFFDTYDIFYYSYTFTYESPGGSIRRSGSYLTGGSLLTISKTGVRYVSGGSIANKYYDFFAGNYIFSKYYSASTGSYDKVNKKYKSSSNQLHQVDINGKISVPIPELPQEKHAVSDVYISPDSCVFVLVNYPEKQSLVKLSGNDFEDVEMIDFPKDSYTDFTCSPSQTAFLMNENTKKIDIYRFPSFLPLLTMKFDSASTKYIGNLHFQKQEEYLYFTNKGIYIARIKNPLRDNILRSISGVGRKIRQLGDTIQFYNFSTGNPDEYMWDFGDGNTSTEKEPTHQYSETGKYQVVLSASKDGETKYDTLNLHIIPDFKADFDIVEKPTTLPLNFVFENTSYGDIDSLVWDFGDGNQSRKPDKRILHSYLGLDTFEVKLKVYSNIFSDSVTKQIYTTGIKESVLDSTSIVNAYAPDHPWQYFKYCRQLPNGKVLCNTYIGNKILLYELNEDLSPGKTIDSSYAYGYSTTDIVVYSDDSFLYLFSFIHAPYYLPGTFGHSYLKLFSFSGDSLYERIYLTPCYGLTDNHPVPRLFILGPSSGKVSSLLIHSDTLGYFKEDEFPNAPFLFSKYNGKDMCDFEQINKFRANVSFGSAYFFSYCYDLKGHIARNHNDIDDFYTYYTKHASNLNISNYQKFNHFEKIDENGFYAFSESGDIYEFNSNGDSLAAKTTDFVFRHAMTRNDTIFAAGRYGYAPAIVAFDKKLTPLDTFLIEGRAGQFHDVSSMSDGTILLCGTRYTPEVIDSATKEMQALPWLVKFRPPREDSIGEIKKTIQCSVFPNPSTGKGTLKIELEQSRNIEIKISDISGRRITTLYSGPATEGTLMLPYDLSGKASGKYLYRITGDGLNVSGGIMISR